MGKSLGLILLLGFYAVIIAGFIFFVSILQSSTFVSGCILRYSETDSVRSDVFEDTMIINANGYYEANVGGLNTAPIDRTKYGKWVNTGKEVTKGQELKFGIAGKVSLCRSYLPRYNVLSDSALDKNGQRVPIARMGEAPTRLIFDSSNGIWRNVIAIYAGDELDIALSRSPRSNVTQVSEENLITKEIITENCEESKLTYKPVCGRFTHYNERFNSYMDKCETIWSPTADVEVSVSECKSQSGCDVFETIWTKGCALKSDGVTTHRYWARTGDKICAYSDAMDPKTGELTGRHALQIQSDAKVCSFSTIMSIKFGDNPTWEAWRLQNCMKKAYGWVWSNAYASDHPPYSTSSIIRPIRDSARIDDYYVEMNKEFDCTKESDRAYINGPYQEKKRFWHVAENVSGLLIRKVNFDHKNYSQPPSGREDNFQVAQPLGTQTLTIADSNIAVSEVKGEALIQLRYFNKEDFSHNNGGYVLEVRHSKCVREKGYVANDPEFDKRGQVQYFIGASGEDPNSSTPSSNEIINIDFDTDKGKYNTAKPQHIEKTGKIWARILNKKEDYPDSYGSYQLRIMSSIPLKRFTDSVITPILDLTNRAATTIGDVMFKNITCYKHTPTASCTNFFLYVKAMLTIYVMLYGIMFTLGIVQINHYDLVIRIGKIAIVAGLINGNTFELFKDIVFPFTMNFISTIVSNINGFALYHSLEGVPNPFIFIDHVMSRIFLSKVFFAQLLALLGIGLVGIFYFVMIFITVGLFVLTIARSIATYIMATLGIGLLLGLAPLFLTFVLFETTKGIFENWLKALAHFMIEPVVLLGGLTIMTALFTLYLDNTLSYSVCWKCALSFKIPILNLLGLPAGFTNIPVFCFNWLTPWGYGGTGHGAEFSLSMSSVAGLLIIACCMYNYVEVASSLASSLTGSFGISSIKAASQMTKIDEKGVFGAALRAGTDAAGITDKNDTGTIGQQLRASATKELNKKLSGPDFRYNKRINEEAHNKQKEEQKKQKDEEARKKLAKKNKSKKKKNKPDGNILYQAKNSK